MIGLTGSIGAGKSLVAGMFAERGCAVIHADELAHQVLEEEGGQRIFEKNFGPEVFGADGRVDRRKLADRVFDDPAKIRLLEGFVHPEVIRRQNEQIAHFQADPGVRAIVLEVPLLIESGLKKLCDWVIVVDADLEIRQRRVAESRGWSQEELLRREKFFFSIYLKRSIADAIVYNNSTKESCRQQVETIYSRIISSVPCQLA